MSYYLEIPLSNGQVVLADVTSTVEEVIPASSARDLVGKLPEVFGDGLERVRKLASEALEQLRSLAEPPDVVTVEFGVQFSAKAGLVVAESTGGAHMKIGVEWHRDRGAPAPELREEGVGAKRA